MPNIAFVPTAGAKEEAFREGRKLPMVFIWSIFKWTYDRLGIKVAHLEELKEETLTRLEKALELYQARKVSEIFLSGGASQRSPSTAEMMANWLMVRGVPAEAITINDSTLQTGDSAEAFASYLWHEYPFYFIQVFLVTSWYHVFRAKLEIVKALRNEAVDFWECPVHPPLTRECLGREYLYNLLTEPFKLLASCFGQLKNWYRKKEAEARGLC